MEIRIEVRTKVLRNFGSVDSTLGVGGSKGYHLKVLRIAPPECCSFTSIVATRAIHYLMRFPAAKHFAAD